MPRNLGVRLALAGLLTLFVWAPGPAPLAHLTIQSHRAAGQSHPRPVSVAPRQRR
jgi:hypothetical protein